jgi:hypothetical protein
VAETTTIRIDCAVHDEFKRLVRERETTVADIIARAYGCCARSRWARPGPALGAGGDRLAQC